jgi:predicted aspartyl protease
MAGRLFGAVDCYSHDRITNQPRLKIRLSNFAEERWHNDTLAPIDTGFSGAVMLPAESYEFFIIGELPRRLWKEYRTVIGPLQMRVARAFVQTEEERTVETVVETPLFGTGKLLLGRTILNSLSLLLDGPAKLSCLMKPAEEKHE